MRSEAREIPVASIDRNPSQPREEFDNDKLDELATSLNGSGLLQRIIVRPKGDRFELIAGERRWRAAQLAKWTVISAEIRHGISDAQAAELALIENVLREDLKPIELARGLKRLVDTSGASRGDVSKLFGKSRTWAINIMRLLELPAELQQQVDSGELPQRIARVLVPYADRPEVIAAAMEARRSNPRSWEDTDVAKENVDFLASTFDELASAPLRSGPTSTPRAPRLKVMDEPPATRLLRDRDVRELLKPFAASAADLAAIAAEAQALLAKL